jgi:hypothetical protein
MVVVKRSRERSGEQSVEAPAAASERVRFDKLRANGGSISPATS